MSTAIQETTRTDAELLELIRLRQAEAAYIFTQERECADRQYELTKQRLRCRSEINRLTEELLDRPITK